MALRFVDADAAVGGNGTTNSLTGTSCAYKSLSLAEAALPSTLAEPWDIVCESSGFSHTADTTAVTFGGVTTTATNRLTVKTSASARHSGVYSTSKYRLEVNGNNFEWCIANQDIYHLDVIGLQMKQTGGNSGNGGIRIAAIATTQTHLVDSCIIADTGSNYGWGIWESSAGQCTIRNCVICNCGSSGSYGCAINSYHVGQGTTLIENCTLVNNPGGIYGSVGATTVKNCYVHNNGGSASYIDCTLTNCASSDATGSAGLQNIAYSASTGAKFTSVTSGSENLLPQSGSALIDAGTDLSSSFTKDITGTTRSGTWDIGAFEVASQAPSGTTGTGSGLFGASAAVSGTLILNGQGSPIAYFASGASGRSVVISTGAAGLSASAMAAGSGVISGSGASPFLFGVSAVAVPVLTGNGTGVLVFSDSAAGTPVIIGPGASGFGLAAFASGAEVSTLLGSGSGLFVLGTSVIGSPVVAGVSSNAYSFGASAAGRTLIVGSTAAGLSLGSVAQGQTVILADGTVGFLLSPTAAGQPMIVGDGDGALLFVATGRDTVFVPESTRMLVVLPERRVLRVEPEPRVYIVPAESRIVKVSKL